MDPDLSPLDEFLADGGRDGYLFDSDSGDSDHRYVSGFDASDPFVTLYTPETTALLVGGLEYGRARSESRADAVRRRADYDFRAKVAGSDRWTAIPDVLAEFLAEFDAGAVAVPKRFPVWTADGLRERGVSVDVDVEGVVEDVRAVKTDREIEHVRTAQRTTEAAMGVVEDLLTDATVEWGVLHHDGDVLTSERVKREVDLTLLRHGCRAGETIVACGADAAEPHNTGSGPLRADETIVVDIFPRDAETNYHADMTRTFVRGEPSAEARAFHGATLDAMAAAFDAIEPGATGEAVNDAVCDAYEAAGYPTLRSDDRTETGFIHSTGHGVGLDVHENPRLARDGGELRPGHVVTVEPGLYDPEVGGMRVEDLVVVTENGFENLTDYHTDLVVG